jgi:hypothetical protein
MVLTLRHLPRWNRTHNRLSKLANVAEDAGQGCRRCARVSIRAHNIERESTTLPTKYSHGTKGFGRYLASRAEKRPRNATSDFKASAAYNASKKRNWTCSSLQQFCFHQNPRFFTLMAISEGTPWKIAENRTLKRGSSPPRAEEST